MEKLAIQEQSKKHGRSEGVTGADLGPTNIAIIRIKTSKDFLWGFAVGGRIAVSEGNAYGFESGFTM